VRAAARSHAPDSVRWRGATSSNYSATRVTR
jgi:hypothetical protein